MFVKIECKISDILVRTLTVQKGAMSAVNCGLAANDPMFLIFDIFHNFSFVCR